MSEHQRLAVNLPDGRSYPILLGGGLLGAPALLDSFVGSQVLIVSNAKVAVCTSTNSARACRPTGSTLC